MVTVLGMCLGVLAGVCLPAEVSCVDGIDQQVHLVRWPVLQVHVCSLLGAATLDLFVFVVARAVLEERMSDAVGVLFAGTVLVRFFVAFVLFDQVDDGDGLVLLSHGVPFQLTVVMGL